jgi:hypothetical protein
MNRWFVLVVFMASTAVLSASVTAEEQVPYYSSRDTEKYRTSADAQPAGTQKAGRETRKKEAARQKTGGSRSAGAKRPAPVIRR